MTAEAHANVRFRRAIERRALWAAEDAARELPNLPLEDALQLVRLYAEQGSPKDEKAAMRWLERYLAESSPRLEHFAEKAAPLAMPAKAPPMRWLKLWRAFDARPKARSKLDALKRAPHVPGERT